MNTADLITEVTEVIGNTSSEEELSDVILGYCRNYGVGSFVFGAALYSNLSPTPELRMLNGYPEEWRKCYDDMAYMTCDLTVSHCQVYSTPLIWLESKDISGASRKIFSGSSNLKINSGISFPYHGSTGEFGMFSVSSSDQFNKSGLENAATQYVMQIIGASLFDHYKKKVQESASIKLTKREIECLKWVAAGKTSWETSRIIDVSERTVIFHIQNAASKMNTASRTNAAVIATMNGVI